MFSSLIDKINVRWDPLTKFLEGFLKVFQEKSVDQFLKKKTFGMPEETHRYAFTKIPKKLRYFEKKNPWDFLGNYFKFIS